MIKYVGFALIHGKSARCFKVFKKTYAVGFWFLVEIPF